MKTKRLALALTVATSAALLLAACGAPSEGVVHDKRYHAAYSYDTQDCVMRQTYHRSDGTTYSTCTMYQTHTHRVPADYALDIYSQDDKKHGWKDVTKKEYESLGVGDWYGSNTNEQSSGGGF